MITGTNQRRRVRGPVGWVLAGGTILALISAASPAVAQPGDIIDDIGQPGLLVTEYNDDFQPILYPGDTSYWYIVMHSEADSPGVLAFEPILDGVAVDYPDEYDVEFLECSVDWDRAAGSCAGVVTAHLSRVSFDHENATLRREVGTINPDEPRYFRAAFSRASWSMPYAEHMLYSWGINFDGVGDSSGNPPGGTPPGGTPPGGTPPGGTPPGGAPLIPTTIAQTGLDGVVPALILGGVLLAVGGALRLRDRMKKGTRA